MKILMLNYEYPPIGGGGGKAFQHLLEYYAQQSDLEIDVLTTSSAASNRIEPFSKNITLYKVGIHKKNLHFWRKIEVLEWLFKARKLQKTLMSDNTYDLAHAFFGFPTGWLTYREHKRMPYIISLRGSDVPGDNPRLKLDYFLLSGVFHKIWDHAVLLVANSKGLSEKAKAFAPHLHYEVIPNGIDTNLYTPSETKSPLKPLKLITVGRLTQVKCLDMAIRAIYFARKAGLDTELTIVGQGNLMPELKALTHSLELSQHIHFTGWIETENMPELYRKHHAFMLTSRSEGMNNAMLEAMACGLPIISTACEGTEELITTNGFIMPNPDAHVIANTIASLANNMKTYQEMSEVSRQQSLRFNWAAAANAYINIYRTSHLLYEKG